MFKKFDNKYGKKTVDNGYKQVNKTINIDEGFCSKVFLALNNKPKHEKCKHNFTNVCYECCVFCGNDKKPLKFKY